MTRLFNTELRGDYLSALPTEIILGILSYLNPKELRNVSLICRLFNHLSSCNHLWQHFIPLNHFATEEVCSSLGVKSQNEDTIKKYKPRLH